MFFDISLFFSGSEHGQFLVDNDAITATVVAVKHKQIPIHVHAPIIIIRI
jgi:hypothetical protein